MSTYIICKNQQDRKVPLEVCQTKCKAQWDCEPFNKIMFDKNMEEQVEKPVEGMMIGDPEEESDDTDVRQEIIERPLATVPLNGKAQSLYQQVLFLKAEIEVRWFELGKILQEIFDHKYYRDLGFETWKNFVFEDLEPLGMKWRTADYLRMTVMKCEEVGIKKEVAGQIGWSKLKEIVPVVTKKNKDGWIKEANQKTVQSLNAAVRVALGKITEEESKVLPEKVFFSLFKEQKQLVELSLEVAGRVSRSDKKGHLLADVICPSFLAEYPVGAEEGSRPEIIVRLLGRFEAAFKVKFTGEVVDVETGEILVEARE